MSLLYDRFLLKKLNTCRYFILMLFVIFFPIGNVVSQTQQNNDIDLVKVSITLDVNPLSPQLSGVVTHDIKFLSSNKSKLQLALHQNYNVQIEKCFISNLTSSEYTFTRNASTIDIDFSASTSRILNTADIYSITIVYSGEIPDDEGTYSIHGFKFSEKYIATLSEPFGEKDWWPVFNTDLFNKYETMKMTLKFPEQYKGASNGLLTSEISSNGIKTQVWEHDYPIESYLIAFAVGEYVEYNFKINLLSGKQLNINNYVFPAKLEIVKKALEPLQDYMRVLETRLGEYPFHKEKYGHASFGFRGGMEHQTISFIGGDWPSFIVIHELVHQWLGDLITTHSWEEMWLNEGLTTYFEYVVIDDLKENTDAIKNKLKLFKDLSIFYSHLSLIVKDTTSTNAIFHRSIYYKGAYIVHKLRVLVGDDIFFTALKNYLNNNKYGYVTIEKLKNEFKKLTDLDIDKFFEHWVYGTGVPTLNINIKALSDSNKYALTIAQNGGVRPYYYMKVPVNITLKDGSIQKKIYLLDDTSKTFVFTTPAPLENLIVDPYNDALIRATNYNTIQKEAITVYPNPLPDTVDNITLKFATLATPKQKVVVTIVNNYGIKFSTQEFILPEDYKIECSTYGLPQGTYIVLVDLGNQLFAKKILKN